MPWQKHFARRQLSFFLSLKLGKSPETNQRVQSPLHTHTTMKTQCEMFYESHSFHAKSNILKNLDLAMAKRREAVQAWRDAGSDESRWEEFTAEIDRLVDAAEKNLL